MKRDSFTLAELIITISIIGILASTIIIVINPAQLLDQGRDARRISDLNSLDENISSYIYQGPGLSGLGTTNTVYVSIPDTSAACSNLSLPTLPPGWSYNCVTQTNLFNVNGTGWLPINFTQMAGGSPISTLPIDPINLASKGEYYTYVTNGTSFELTGHFESDKYQTYAATDGGDDPTTYEIGDNLNLSPFLHGLVGLWNFNDASGGLNSTTADLSGWGNNGTLLDATSTGTGPTYLTAGCLSGGCLSFDGTDDFIRVLNSSSTNPGTNNWTVNVWFDASSVTAGILYNKESLYEAEVHSDCGQNGCYAWQPSWAWYGQNFNATTGAWTMMTVVYNGSDQYFYKNGTLVYYRTQAGSMGINANNLTFAARSNGSADFYNGLLDDISMYNTALTSAQIQAIYNAEKP
ncbi:MAG: LamG domain-containing protein [Patescibacteria group bacterium]|nr:LamG domain-containing protein [Patescibacteria group bacterium]